MKKKIVLVLLAVLLGGGTYLYLNMGDIITRTAEKIASGALGVKVDITDIDVSLSEKKVTVNGVEIGNPPGYRKANAMTADTILIGLNTASRELIDFNDIQVKGAVVNLEVNEKGMNLLDLKKLANRKEQKDSVGSEQIRVIVQRMAIDASTINPSVSLFNKGDIGPIHMPAISFSNIGKGGGTSAGNALVQVLTKYLTAVEKEARKGGLLDGTSILDDVGDTLDGAAEGLKGLFN